MIYGGQISYIFIIISSERNIQKQYIMPRQYYPSLHHWMYSNYKNQEQAKNKRSWFISDIRLQRDCLRFDVTVESLMNLYVRAAFQQQKFAMIPQRQSPD